MLAKDELIQQLKKIIYNFSIVVLFSVIFKLIESYYLTGRISKPIDIRFFDPTYVTNSKSYGYDICNYFKFFFPLDLGFPIVYTTLFLSALIIFRERNFRIYRILAPMAFLGGIFDYLENFSFALYLKTSLNIPILIALFTSIKIILVIINCIAFLISLLYITYGLIRRN